MAVLKSVAGYVVVPSRTMVQSLVVVEVKNQRQASQHPTFKEVGVDYGPVEIELKVGMTFSLIGEVTLDQVHYTALSEGRLPTMLDGWGNTDLFPTARCLKTREVAGVWFLETQNATYRLEGLEKRHGVRYALKFLWDELKLKPHRLRHLLHF